MRTLVVFLILLALTLVDAWKPGATFQRIERRGPKNYTVPEARGTLQALYEEMFQIGAFKACHDEKAKEWEACAVTTAYYAQMVDVRTNRF